MNNFLSLLHVSRSFQGEEVLHNITLRFPKSGFIGILGPSGCGKSTLLSILAGIDEGYEGTVLFDDREMGKKTAEERAAFRLENIGMVFQKGELLELETALQNVMFPLTMLSKESKAGQKEKALSMLYALKMEKKAKKKVRKMSGGERQRVAISRALVTSPAMVLADEPTSALDEENGRLVMDLFLEISRTRLVIVVSHDENLLQHYAERLIRLKDGKVISDTRLPQIQSKPRFITPLENKKEKPSLSFFERIGHASRRRKAKRFRTLISEAALSLGLLGLGLSVYVSSSISHQVSAVFSSIVPSGLIVMEKQNKDAVYSNLALGTQEEADAVFDAFPEDISWRGKTYLYDFESSFPDENEFHYSCGVQDEILPGFSSRSVNDFQNVEGISTYPSLLPDLSFDDLVLGLPYETMAQLCGKFGLPKGYSYLGDYCASGRFSLSLRIGNADWNLSEQITFFVQGVCETKLPSLFHSDPSWNQRILGSYFHIQDIGDGIPLSPQESSTIPFLEITSPFGEFFKKCRREKSLSNVGFDLISADYAPTICPFGETPSIPRLYLYRMPNRGLSFQEMDRGMEVEPRIQGRLPSNETYYYASTESALSGFLTRFFLCQDVSAAKEVQSAYSDLPLESASLLGELPPSVKEGSLLCGEDAKFRVSANLDDVKGRIPKNENEVVLSSSLMEKWGNPEKVNVVVEVDSVEVGNNLSREFERRELLVVGSKNEASDTLFVASDWTIDFFLNQLGVSPLKLEPTACAYFLDAPGKEDEALQNLSSQIPGVGLSCPSSEVMKSLEETTSYFGVALLFFSGVGFLSSVLLFALVISLSVSEGFSEAKTLFAIGVSKKEIGKIYASSALLYCSSAMLGSSLSLLACEIFVSIFLSFAFGTPLSFTISLSPLLWMAGVGALLTGITTGIAVKILHSKDLGSRNTRYS
ncbi:MAG: ABC transporter ATP-binding protein [Candidatus Enteromonas sp.]|nr:ABC transporter ATP-binding protein [Candidatus Enteromonas sp.]